MADLADELAGALDDPGPVPGTGRELVRYAGGKAELTRQIAGMSGPPRRGDYADAVDYEAARRRWRSASRRVQRYTTSGAQKRGARRVVLPAAERERVREAAVDRKWRDMVRRGVRMRLRATIKITSPTPGRRDDVRTRDLPAGGPGVYISPDELLPVLDALDDGDRERAAFDLQVAFADAYGMPDELEVDEVYELKVWPDGEPEPA